MTYAWVRGSYSMPGPWQQIAQQQKFRMTSNAALYQRAWSQRVAYHRTCWVLTLWLMALAESRVMAATNLFTSGQGGYNTYRIPSLYETLDGVLLAFCEGRKNSSSDTGDIDTVLRRSLDGGATWSAQQVVWSDGANTCGNPTVVQDRTNGRLWLFLTWNHGQDTQAKIQAGTSIDVRKIYSCYSDNNGADWSAPVNHFAEVQPPDVRWDATGPGRGIQMVAGSKPGRLIIPANGRNIHSDDHGLTWSQSTWLPGGSSESQEVEISGGVLLRNDRATGGNAQYNARIFCRSGDQGTSWGGLEIRPDLTCPVCQASTIVLGYPSGIGGRMLVFANPAATTRVNMIIRCSLDDGVTWPFSRLVYAGSSAYSCLTKIGTNDIGLLYERDSYARITFEKFAIDEIVTVPQRRTWDGGSGAGNEGWQHANNWDSNSTPTFNHALDVVFHSVGAGNRTNGIGADRTLRSLTFNADADSNVGIYLADKISSPATNYALTFDTFAADGSAEITVESGAAGDFTIGGGGLGSITLADHLVVTHDGSGKLALDSPITESVAGRNLTKNGPGTLILRQNNTYTGTTTLNAGTLLMGNDTVLGIGPLVLNAGTTFASDSGGARSPVNPLTLGGNMTLGQSAGGTGSLTFSGAFDLGGATRTLTINNPNTTLAGTISNGGLTKAGTGTLTLVGANTYTGQTTLFAGTLQLGTGGSFGSTADASAIAIGPNATFQFNRTSSDTDFPNNISGPGTILKTVAGVEFGLTGTNSFSGGLDIQAGKIAFAGANSENGAPSVNVAAAGTLSIGGGFIGGTATIGNLTGAGRIDPAFNSGTGTRTLQINQTLPSIFAGVILDASAGRILAITKTGPATLTLSGTNTHTGPTTIMNGALFVNGTISNSAVTVRAGATLGGAGLIGGAVSVENGGTLSPGSALGSLTIHNRLILAGTVYLELNTTNGQSDRLQGLTSLVYGGTLSVSNVAGLANPPTLGQTFQLFAVAATPSGNFSSISPALTEGLAWRFNPTNGVLSVVAATATYPTNLSFSVSNGTLSLTWPASHLGWVLQSQTNALNIGQHSSWTDVPKSASVTSVNLAILPENPAVFYRLRQP